MRSMRRVFPGVNDEIVERQRRQSGARILSGRTPTLREVAIVLDDPNAEARLAQMRERLRDRPEIAKAELALLVAYNTPGTTDEEFLRDARVLAEALHCAILHEQR